MTYTREEWEPAATAASKVSEQAWMAFSTALTLVEGTKAYQKVFEDALIKVYIELAGVERERDITITHLQQERDLLRGALDGIRYNVANHHRQEALDQIDEALAQPEEKP